ncbi:MAG: enoyl-CoA hydratase/isomerase family protein [Myxococcales bacterium]|nr:enoyl-CoA hydratase/isomerase family protein [Myxococcales bacterium]
MTESETIAIDRDGPLAIVTIRREAALNALSSQVIRELTAAAAALAADAAVRVVVVTGAGAKAFVAGADIAEMQALGPAEAQGFAEAGGRLGAAIEGAPQVWIAAVNGFALGGGCELALACDFIYAVERAKFGQPEVKLGVIPGFGGTQRLARRVGVAKAKELCVTGDQINAAEALRIGLVDAVFADAQGADGAVATPAAAAMMTAVRALAGRIAANGPLAVAAAKRCIHLGQSMTLPDALALEQREFGALFATADQREGMTAFLGKRAAQFTGS